MRIAFTLLVLLQVLLAKAQVAYQLIRPNGSFEHWHTVGTYGDPDGWTTNNSSTFTGVEKDSVQHYDSLLSMKVLANGTAISSKNRPWYASAYFRYRLKTVGNDTVGVKIYRYNGNTLIDSTSQKYTQSNNYWSEGFCWVGFQIDSVRMMFTGGHNVGTTFNIDAAGFLFESVENISAQLQASISPNPIQHAAIFHFNNPTHDAYRWMLIDINGTVIKEVADIRTEQFRIDRGGQPAGAYTWQIWKQQEAKRATGKLLIE